MEKMASMLEEAQKRAEIAENKVIHNSLEGTQKKTSSKNERTNLFFYPDSPELPET